MKERKPKGSFIVNWEECLKGKISDCKEIPVEKIVFSDELLKYCAKNQCGKYNTNWMCPPAVGKSRDLMEKYRGFKKALIISKVSPLEDPFDIKGMEAAQTAFQKILFDLQNDLKAKKDFAILGAGACSRCESCTYPDHPCRFPDLAFPSLEALGINVTELAHACKMKYNNGANTVTYFAAIFYD